jgi:Protein of unknown function (DUF2934)
MKAVQHDVIRLRAYEIWESSGRPDGLEKEHWEQAERELLDAAPEVERDVAEEPATDDSLGAAAGAASAEAADRDSPEVRVTPVPNRSGARNRSQQSQETVKRP